MGKKPRKKKIHVKRKHIPSLTPDKGTSVRRTYKDSLFRFIFQDRQKLLQLYNALNGSSYQNAEDLVITTLENIIYLGYKNDFSFLLDWVLFLAEHQGSWNPNMPLRGVFYFARLYKDFVDASEYNLYGTAQIPLPFPQYVIFYNGTAEHPEREILRLSDSFQVPDYINEKFKEPALECKALVLNINYGKNKELLEKCRPLLDYSHFIYCIRQNLAKGFTLEKSVDMAIEFCLKNDILSDVLRAHRKEVISMFLEAADDERYWKLTLRDLSEKSRAEGQREGRREGQERLNRLNEYLLRDKRMDDLHRSFTDTAFQETLFKEYGL